MNEKVWEHRGSESTYEVKANRKEEGKVKSSDEQKLPTQAVGAFCKQSPAAQACRDVPMATTTPSPHQLCR